MTTFSEICPGHIPLPDNAVRECWNQAIIAFDANALLNVYRYSINSSKEFVSILKKLQSRVWIPYWAAREFVENRVAVLGEQEQCYSKAIDDLASILSRLEHDRQHPFVPEEVLTASKSHFDALRTSLENQKLEYKCLITNDPLFTDLSTIFRSKIGTKPTNEALKALCSKGKERFESRIPPGFRDAKKDAPRCYKDYFIWHELVEEAKKRKLPLIFVTNDEKDDWWRILGGEKQGPLPALVEEMQHEAQQHFLLYTPARFLERARDLLNQTVSEAVIDEAKANVSKSLRRPHVRLTPLTMPLSDGEAKRWIKNMANSKRMPTLIKRLDELSVGVFAESSLESIEQFGESQKQFDEKLHSEIRSILKPWSADYLKSAGWILFSTDPSVHKSVSWIHGWREVDWRYRLAVRNHIMNTLLGLK